jgi:peroxiredoxin
VGTRAPNFTLRDVTGKPYSLHVYTGEPMVLEFFAVWCPVCHAEAPAMTRLTASYVPKGVHVWSILANGYGRDYETSGRTDLRPVDATDLSWYARTYNVHHPQLIDPTFDVTNEYGANSYPTIYILDSDGIIRYTNAGRVSYAALARSLDRVVHASISG